MESYLIEKSFLAITRTHKDGKKECLVNFHKNFRNSAFKKLKNNLNVDIVYVYIDDKYNEELTNYYNLKNIDEEESLPHFDFTKSPSMVSMQSENIWSEVRHKAFIPSIHKNDWDFFELEWILNKWNSSFGFFDYDTFLIIPTYPKDLMNNLIPPDIIFYTVQRYKKKNSLDKLKKNFYALYLFHKDVLGRKMLEFFYEETVEKTSDLKELIQKIHKIYHLTKEKNLFRPFIYYNSNCVDSKMKKIKFDVKKYILIFLSFHSIFFCSHFTEIRKEAIYHGIKTSPKLACLQQYFDSPESIVEEVKKIDQANTNVISWLSRDHFKHVDTPLSKYIYNNWNYLRRNINLWDLKVFGYIDSQLICGFPLQELFPYAWTENFHNKNYTFENILPKRIRPKRKLN